MRGSAACETVSDEATEDLGEAVEAEPDAGAEALLALGVPLRN